MATTYDPSVFDLAEHFLSDDDTNTQARAGVHHKRVDSLARTIQQAIEDWCEDEINEQEGE